MIKAKLLSVSKKLQQLIFGQISTTTEIQFNATYSDDIGHIHIDRPAGFLSKSEAKFIDGDLLAALEKELVCFLFDQNPTVVDLKGPLERCHFKLLFIPVRRLGQKDQPVLFLEAISYSKEGSTQSIFITMRI